MEGKNKVLLDAQGNPITRERIEEVMREVFKDTEPFLQKCEWEEDGKLYHCWKIKTGVGGREMTAYTNDAGAAQIELAMRDWVKKEYGTDR